MTRDEACEIARKILETLDWSAPALAQHLAAYRAQLVGYRADDQTFSGEG